MIRPPSRAGFTLIEMITVMTVIVILVSLVLSVNSLVQKKAAMQRTLAEIASLSLAVKNYETDNASPPRLEAVTEPKFVNGQPDNSGLSARTHGAPANGDQLQRYTLSSQVLYRELTGDVNLDFRISNDETARTYAGDFFRPERMRFDNPKAPDRRVQFVQDPFGNCYGYSTAGLAQEEAYTMALRRNPRTERPTQTQLRGYNPTFDLWSTTGSNVIAPTDPDRVKWVKNW